MLDNTITLPVDVLNDSTTVDEIFTRYQEFQDRSVYIGPGHALQTRNIMTFARNFPTISGNFKGVAKSSIKCTEDIQVPGVDETTSNTAPLIGGVNYSIPVGATAAQCMALRQRLVAAIDNDLLMARSSELLEV